MTDTVSETTNFLTFTQDIHTKLAELLLKDVPEQWDSLWTNLMAKIQTLEPGVKYPVALVSVTILAGVIYKWKSREDSAQKNSEDMDTALLEKIKSQVAAELKSEQSKQLKFHAEKIDELTRIEKEISKVISEMPRLTEEMDDIKTQQEMAKCGQDAQRKMQEHLHSKIEDLVGNTSKINQQADQVSFRQNQQDSRLDDLERTIDDLMNKSRDYSDLHLPTVTNCLSDFKTNMMNEVEDYLRSTNATQTRQLKGEIAKIKDDTFHLSESALQHETFVAQEMRDLQMLLQDSEKRIKHQMYDMENRIKSQKSTNKTHDKDFRQPHSMRLPPSSNTSGVSSYSEDVGAPITASTPLNDEIKQARQNFPSKIRPPNAIETPKATPMSKALSPEKHDCGDSAVPKIPL